MPLPNPNSMLGRSVSLRLPRNLWRQTMAIKATAVASTASSFHSTARTQEKILCVLYPDPTTGYPPRYVRDNPMDGTSRPLPVITQYPDGQTTPPIPPPDATGRHDFVPGELLGCVSGELGLRRFLEQYGHELVVTADKDGEGCEFERHLVDGTNTFMSQLFSAYLTTSRCTISCYIYLTLFIPLYTLSLHLNTQPTMLFRNPFIQPT
jgi:hypothetical protein